MATITIQKNIIQKRGGIVLLPLREYQKLLEQQVPTYYLSGAQALQLDRLVKSGMREYRCGNARRIRSLDDLN